MTPEKQALLAKLNQTAEATHQDAVEMARRLGKQAPAAPVPLTPEDIEFPKYVHKGWEETDLAPGHFKPSESKLVHNAEELKAYLAKGYSEAPTKPEVKAEPKSKKE